MNADPFGVPGRDSRAEPPCTVGAARPPARERVREWLLPVMTIFTTVSENGYNATATYTVVVTRTEVT